MRVRSILVVAGACLAAAGWIGLFLRDGVRTPGIAQPSVGQPAPSGPHEPRGLLAPETERQSVLPGFEEGSDPIEGTARGQVLEEGTARPLPGVHLQLMGTAVPRADTISDENGRFQFTIDRSEALSIRVPSQVGFSAVEAPRALTSSERQGRTPLVVRVRSNATARVRGRVLYESTGQPVPYCFLHVRTPGSDSEAAETDADGRFSTNRRFDTGPIEVLIGDHRSRDSDWRGALLAELTEGDAELEFRVRLGPTFWLETTSAEAPDLEGFRAWVDGSGFDNSRVRRKGGLFCRFVERDRAREASGSAIDGFAIPRGSPRTLHFEDEEGLWLGEAQVLSMEGVHPGVVPVELELRGALLVQIDSKERTPRTVVTIGLIPLAAGAEDLPLAFSWGRGHHHFSHLLPGGYRLSIHGDYCEPVVVDVWIETGKLTTTDVVLDCLPLVGSISGTLRSRSGNFHSEETLVHLANGEHSEQADVLWRQDGEEWVGTYESPRLPQLEHTLLVRAPTAFPWQPPLASAHPGDRVDFLLEDMNETFDLAFSVLDARTSLPIEPFHATLTPRFHDFIEASQAVNGEVLLRDFPEGGSLRWNVTRPGYACAEGDIAAFSIIDHGGARRRRIAKVMLEPGLHAALELWNDRDDQPIAGAEVWLDDALAGVTDKEGALRIDRDSFPQSVAVRYRDWQLDPEDVAVLETLTSESPCGGLFLALQPPR